jgi:hypothetical protein
LDARALNLEQARLLFDPSVEVDSLLELPAALLRAGAPAVLVSELSVLCRRVLESNLLEGERERVLAGVLDEQLAAIRVLPVAGRLTAKGIARAVRGPLGVVLDGGGGDAVRYFRACCAVRDVVAAVPRAQLLAPAVRHELRERKFRLLAELAAAEIAGVVDAVAA